ncbi:MAG TPA: YihY/virulence factor BrkB family protein [Candidatus Melainabacteria bacterium]|nr:YihY/virulence factor BrkB family protein [Candidatus Melainabacteria bacterium]
MARDKDIVSKAAAIAFYSIIALVPLLVIVISSFSILVPVPSQFVYQGAAQSQQSGAVYSLRSALRQLLPREAFVVVDSQIERAREMNPYATLSVGLFAAFWTASGVFGTICKCMNQIYDRPHKRSYMELKLLAFLLVLLQTVIFLSAMTAFFLWPQIEPYLGLSNVGHIKAIFIEWLVFTLVVLSSFTLLLHIGPTGPRYHPLVTPGALLATPAFLFATGIFRFYVSHMSSYHEMYGPLGGVMVLMLWFWGISIILLVGAVLDCVILRAAIAQRAAGLYNGSEFGDRTCIARKG